MRAGVGRVSMQVEEERVRFAWPGVEMALQNTLHHKVLTVNARAILGSVILSVLGIRLAIFQCSDSVLPYGQFFSHTRAAGEFSYVAEERGVPEAATAVSRGWIALMVHGPLDFSLTGILASVAVTLAEAGVSIFALSTYDTDYVLVKEETKIRTIAALRAAGHEVEEP